MGLDSIEIVMTWEEAFDISIADAEAEALCTPLQAVELIAAKLEAVDEHRPCPTLCAFHDLRRQLVAAGVPRRSIRPGSRLRELKKGLTAAQWRQVRRVAPGWFVSRRSIGALARSQSGSFIILNAKPGEARRWSRAEIRNVVRQSVIDIVGHDDFDDDSEFIRDIGIQ